MSGFSSEAPSARNFEARLLRIADVLIAVALLVFTLPLMVLVGLTMKLERSGSGAFATTPNRARWPAVHGS